MALWSNETDLSHDVYTVVYLLKDALRSAIEDAWFFERSDCQKPEMKGAGHAEITARLGRYRDACATFKEREALMVTKILRAREWAFELRKSALELQDDIDQFLDASEPCFELQADFVSDTDRLFHGGGALSRFIASPQGGGGPGGYLVAGQTQVFELRAACEVFLSQINEVFFSRTVPEAERLDRPFSAYLEAADEQAPALHS